MDAGAAGIGEQVQEVLTFTHLAEHATGDTVVEEQTGIRVVGEVDPQARVILLHLNKVALLRHLLILVFPFCRSRVFSTNLLGAMSSTAIVAAMMSNRRWRALCASTVFGGAYSGPPPSRHSGQWPRCIPVDQHRTGDSIQFLLAGYFQTSSGFTQTVSKILRQHRRLAAFALRR